MIKTEQKYHAVSNNTMKHNETTQSDTQSISSFD